MTNVHNLSPPYSCSLTLPDPLSRTFSKLKQSTQRRIMTKKQCSIAPSISRHRTIVIDFVSKKMVSDVNIHLAH